MRVLFNFVLVLQGFVSCRLKIHRSQRGLREEKHVSEADASVGEKCRNKEKRKNITTVAPSPPCCCSISMQRQGESKAGTRFRSFNGVTVFVCESELSEEGGKWRDGR